MTDTPIRTADAPPPADPTLTSRPYRHYVLGVLFLTYVLNVIDRSPVLGVSLQYIKEEFAVSDTQLGLLTGIALRSSTQPWGFRSPPGRIGATGGTCWRWLSRSGAR